MIINGNVHNTCLSFMIKLCKKKYFSIKLCSHFFCFNWSFSVHAPLLLWLTFLHVTVKLMGFVSKKLCFFLFFCGVHHLATFIEIRLSELRLS
jgi:hypothetical protein